MKKRKAKVSKPKFVMPDWSKPHLTVGDVYGAAMKVETKEQADEFVRCAVHRMVTMFGVNPDEAPGVLLSNIGYHTGYYDNETADRVMRLFNCAHPVFGLAHPTPEEAAEAGLRKGAK